MGLADKFHLMKQVAQTVQVRIHSTAITSHTHTHTHTPVHM